MPRLRPSHRVPTYPSAEWHDLGDARRLRTSPELEVQRATNLSGHRLVLRRLGAKVSTLNRSKVRTDLYACSLQSTTSYAHTHETYANNSVCIPQRRANDTHLDSTIGALPSNLQTRSHCGTL